MSAKSAAIPSVPRESIAVGVDASTHPHVHVSDAAGAIAVILTKDRAAGLLRVGAYVPGTSYFLPPGEAIRLVDVKRFQYATEADASRAAAWIEQRNAAALAQAAAATDAGEGGGIPATKDEE